MRFALLLSALTLLPAAQDAKLVGLQPGEELPGSFRPYNVTGNKNFKDRFHSLTVEYGLDPVILVFLQGKVVDDYADASTFLKQLSDLVPKNSRNRLRAYAVVVPPDLKDALTDDDLRQEKVVEVRKLDQTAGLEDGKNLPLALDSLNNLKSFKLDPQAQVTVILYNEHKIVAAYPFAKGEIKDQAKIDTVLKDGLTKLIAASKKK